MHFLLTTSGIPVTKLQRSSFVTSVTMELPSSQHPWQWYE